MAGPAEVVADHSWPGTSTTVLRLRATDGRQMILKTNTSTDSFRRERKALSYWAPALGASAPQLLDADGDAQLLLMSSVPASLCSHSPSLRGRSVTPTDRPALCSPASTTPRPAPSCPRLVPSAPPLHH
ncbi:hypothetical protein O1L68_41585 [Streptomyces lydicus]|nr:hypothetical protein [Streptomyces lydicus]